VQAREAVARTLASAGSDLSLDIGTPGGVDELATHIDSLVHRPTIVAGFVGAGERTIREDGVLDI